MHHPPDDTRKATYHSEDGDEQGVVGAHELHVVCFVGGLVQQLQLVGDGYKQLVCEGHEDAQGGLSTQHTLHLPASLNAALQLVAAQSAHVQLGSRCHHVARGHRGRHHCVLRGPAHEAVAINKR